MNTAKIARWLTAGTTVLTALLTVERALETTAASPAETSLLHATGIALSAAVAAIGAVITVLKSNDKGVS